MTDELNRVAEQIVDSLDCDSRIRPPTANIISSLRIDLAKNGDSLPSDEEIEAMTMGEWGSLEVIAVQAKFPETIAYIGSLF